MRINDRANDTASSERLIFDEALSLSDPASRADYLNHVCGHDATLRQRIESLLHAAEDAGCFMRRPAILALTESTDAMRPATGRSAGTRGTLGQTTVAVPRDEFAGEFDRDTLIGSILGHYRLISEIGSGGMGRVFLAEDTRLGRRVALKLISPGWIGEGRARFIHEARLAAALEHANICPIYDVGEGDGWCFIAMQYVEGQTLKSLIADRPLKLEIALRIGVQIAEALAAAHARGIVHRDVKPANVMVTPSGHATVLDFGLARLAAPPDEAARRPERIVGTPAYMSPEQAKGEPVDHRSDVFSLGAVLYQLFTGHSPFTADSTAELLRQVGETPHISPGRLNPRLPSKLVGVIDRALAKAPENRFQSMAEFASEIRAIHAKIATDSSPEGVKRRRRGRLAATFSAAAIVIGAIAWPMWSSARIQWARNQISQIEKLAQEGKNDEAFKLARRVRPLLPGDLRLMRIMPLVSDSLGVETEPAGAKVYLSRFDANSPQSTDWKLLGSTPIREREIVRGDYLVRVEKPGFVTFQRSLSGATKGGFGASFDPLRLDLTLIPEADAPQSREMVSVPGGAYRLSGWSRPTGKEVTLDDFWIDRYEVTNRQFQEFVDADGYKNRAFWKRPMYIDGRELSWEEALEKFRDTTGTSGPRGWIKGRYPEGEAEHPVTGVSWYEAAAYAEFRGKSLPSVFQWEKAARNQANTVFGIVMPWGMLQEPADGRANFRTSGTLPVGSMPFGMSPFGCHDMAGNVSEWCRNDTSEGFIVGGASWRDFFHQFGFYGKFGGLEAADNRGFRCVLNKPNAESDQGGARIDIDSEVPRFASKPAEEVRGWFPIFDHSTIKEPLNPQVVDSRNSATYRYQKITFGGGKTGQGIAHLYVPAGDIGPYPVIHFVPAGDVWVGYRTLPESIEANYEKFLEAGWAVYAVEMLSVWDDHIAIHTEEYVDDVAKEIKRVRRGLDYLETCSELDMRRLVYVQASAGGFPLMLPAIDPRYRAVVIWGGGLRKQPRLTNEFVQNTNYLPLITVPKLLVHGRYDETTPLATAARPLFDLLTGPKDMQEFEGGHVPDPDVLADIVIPWLESLPPPK